MQGGGQGAQDEDFIFNHFSDWSVDKMRKLIQEKLVVWNEGLGTYASWDKGRGDYSKVVARNNGVTYAKEREVKVISVMAGVSSTTPQANIVYPPIGPYTSGIIDLFDPTIASDRSSAVEKNYCPSGGCDFSLRVIQGGKLKVFMLPIAFNPSASPTKYESYRTRALNLRGSEGAVTKIELLDTPDAEQEGLPTAPTVLRTWQE